MLNSFPPTFSSWSPALEWQLASPKTLNYKVNWIGIIILFETLSRAIYSLAHGIFYWMNQPTEVYWNYLLFLQQPVTIRSGDYAASLTNFRIVWWRRFCFTKNEAIINLLPFNNFFFLQKYNRLSLCYGPVMTIHV